jgi:hypothetical protein
MAQRDNRIAQLRIDLLGFKPPIWRRVQVPAAFTLADLHDTIQAVFAWQDSHLHAFEVGQLQFGPPMLEDGLTGEKVRPEHRTTLSTLMATKLKKFFYIYDFGDSCEHQVTVEKLLEPDPAVAYPVLTGGRRAAPPEDCGGPPGYDMLVKALQDPDHPDHDEMTEWFGDEPFDPAAMDRAAIERRLQALR